MGQKPSAFTDVFLFCRGYLIAAPSVFRSGVEEAISVTIFNSPREVMVQAQLVALGKAVAQSQGALQGRSLGCLMGPAFLRVQQELQLGLVCSMHVLTLVWRGLGALLSLSVAWDGKEN